MNTVSSLLIDRLRAGAIHLAVSATVAALAAALIFLVWYPAPLAELQGVDRLVVLLIGVDVVLGPLLTVLVYRRGKPSLRFDLAVIALLQVSALAYGLMTIHAGRPALIVFNVDRFDVVAASSVDPDSAARAAAAGQPLPWWRPEWRIAYVPDDMASRDEITFSALSGGPDLPQLPHLQQPYADGRAAVLAAARPMDVLRSLHQLDERRWAVLLADCNGRDPGRLAWLPLVAKVGEGAVIVERDSAVVVSVQALPNLLR